MSNGDYASQYRLKSRAWEDRVIQRVDPKQFVAGNTCIALCVYSSFFVSSFRTEAEIPSVMSIQTSEKVRSYRWRPSSEYGYETGLLLSGKQAHFVLSVWKYKRAGEENDT